MVSYENKRLDSNVVEVLFPILAGKIQQHVDKVLMSALVVTISINALMFPGFSVFLDYSLHSLIQLLMHLQCHCTQSAVSNNLQYRNTETSQAKRKTSFKTFFIFL